MSINGVGQPYAHVQDTVPIPHGAKGRPGKVVIRIAFNDYPADGCSTATSPRTRTTA